MQLDADMLINRPVIPEEVGAAPGTVVSAPYDYLTGTTSGLADLMGIVNKSYQARCGGMHLFHISDLRRIAPLWLHFTQRVREFACKEPLRYYELAAPPERREETFDDPKQINRRRQFMWMVEMYGYVFGAAEAGVPHHRVTGEMMGYVGQVGKTTAKRKECGCNPPSPGASWGVGLRLGPCRASCGASCDPLLTNLS